MGQFYKDPVFDVPTVGRQDVMRVLDQWVEREVANRTAQWWDGSIFYGWPVSKWAAIRARMTELGITEADQIGKANP